MVGGFFSKIKYNKTEKPNLVIFLTYLWNYAIKRIMF